MSIQEYKFSQEELDEIYYALELHNTSLLKYCYILQASKWIFFSKVETSKESIKLLELQLLCPFIKLMYENNYNSNSSSSSTLSIIDLGVGDGQNLLQILNCMNTYVSSQNSKCSPRVCELHLIDISKQMLLHTKEIVSKQYPLIDLNSYNLDFNEEIIIEKIRCKKTNLKWFFLLGSTLGNFEDSIKLLQKIKQSMEVKDSLVIGVELFQKENLDNTLNHYKTIENYEFDIALLKYLGYKDEDGSFEVEMNNKTVISSVKLVRDMKLKISHKELIFKRDEKIILCKSRKFTQEELFTMCEVVGFRISNFKLGSFQNSQEPNYCLLEVKLK